MAVLLVQAFVLCGDAPASENPAQESSKHADPAQNPSNRPHPLVNKNQSAKNAEIKQPETPPDDKSQPSVTIKEIPPVDVKRDWIDCASLAVGFLLVIVGAITGYFIYWQAKKTAEATDAMRDSIRLQEIGMQQWVSLINWQCSRVSLEGLEADKKRFQAHIMVDLVNQSNFPLTLASSYIAFTKMGAAVKSCTSWGFDELFLPPHTPHHLNTPVDLTDEQADAFRNLGFVVKLEGKFQYVTILGMRMEQIIKGILVCSESETRFLADVTMHPKQAEPDQ
jgi:hypothetical protein